MPDLLESPEARGAQKAAADLHARVGPLDKEALDLLFLEARSHNGWLPREVPETLLRELYEITRWGPTSMNCCPARFVFLRSTASKERLRPALAPANVDKVMTAPVVAIAGFDLRFMDRLPQLFPHRDLSGVFSGDPAKARETAFRNATLQAAYLMLAARALGLDCGPMSGFDAPAVDREFFAGTAVQTNFLCGLGYGDTTRLFQRLPRLSFEEACRLE
jgi:3-hydroxypropanoate dehydrogenase